MNGRWCALAVWISAAALGACSDDEDGGSPSESDAVAACHAYCDAEQAADCMAYDSAEECRSTECGGVSGESSECVGAFKAYYDCLNAADDVCAAICLDEFSAAATACS